MSELFPILFVVFISAIVRSLAKKDAKSGSKPAQRQTAQRQPQAMQVTMEQLQAAGYGTAKEGGGQRRELQSTLVTHTPKQSRLQVTPHTKDMFAGSMNYATTEGEDPCHDHDLAPAVNPCELAPRRADKPVATTGGLNLSWTGDSMVKAMVMNEILTRPCDRVRK